MTLITGGLRRRPDPSALRLKLAGVDARWVLAGIVLLAIAVRFVALGTRLTNDDAYSWWVASAPSPHIFFTRLAASENAPPLFYLLLTPLPIDQTAWLRLPAAIPGGLMCLVAYYAFRKPLGARAALLGSLAVAVSPFLITDSDLARGFMLEDLALLLALWAVLELAEANTRRWWFLFVAAGVVALYTEYDSAIFLGGLTLAALWIGRPERRRMALAAAVPFISLVPLIPEIVRSQQQVGITKFNPIHGATSLTQFRDAVITLALGENGGTASSAGRWLEFAVMLAVAIAAAIVLRRSWSVRTAAGQRAILLISVTAGVTLLAHVIGGAVGLQIFTQRYLTILIPLAAALGAASLVAEDWGALVVVASVALVVLGLVNLARRYHGEYQPDVTPVQSAARNAHPRTVLTNSPIVLYYLRSRRAQMDRPYNLGSGRAGSCARPCLIIDDSRVTGGTPRLVAGPSRSIGPYVLILEH